MRHEYIHVPTSICFVVKINLAQFIGKRRHKNENVYS